jgi:hypothetical protein
MSRIKSLLEFIFFGVPLKPLNLLNSEEIEKIDVLMVDIQDDLTPANSSNLGNMEEQKQLGTNRQDNSGEKRSIFFLACFVIGCLSLCVITYLVLVILGREVPCGLWTLISSSITAIISTIITAESSRPTK